MRLVKAMIDKCKYGKLETLPCAFVSLLHLLRGLSEVLLSTSCLDGSPINTLRGDINGFLGELYGLMGHDLTNAGPQMVSGILFKDPSPQMMASDNPRRALDTYVCID